MKGRVHLYEGYSPIQVVFPIRVLAALGIKYLILTNAAGGVSENLKPGDLMIINDHINLTGNNPLLGYNDVGLGSNFLDMRDTYSIKLKKIIFMIAKRFHIELKEGTYACMPGPMYETPAEIKIMKLLGINAVGMSTVYEAIAAHHQKINILAISCISNNASRLSNKKLLHQDVKKVVSKVSEKIENLILNLIKEIS